MVSWHRVDPRTGCAVTIGLAESLEYQRLVQEENRRGSRQSVEIVAEPEARVLVAEREEPHSSMWMLF